jgi:hypothetical protein
MAEWACEFIRWSCNNWMIRLEATSARSLTERNSKIIERMIRNPYAFRKYATPTEFPLLRNGWLPRALLFRMLRHMKQREVDEVLSGLTEADVLGSAEKDDTEIYWWKA